MATTQLDTAIHNFQHINQMAERYTRLCRAYVELSERFHQLDVDHMTLKGQVIPLLKALKTQQDRLQRLQTEKDDLQQTLDQRVVQHRQDVEAMTQSYEDRIEQLTHSLEALRPIERLLSSEISHELLEAETQIELVEATIQEMAEDNDPDLSSDEKALLEAYRANPGAFLAGF